MASDSAYPPLDDSISRGWMRHLDGNAIPVEQFPTATAPAIYEGFVPQHQHLSSEQPPYPQNHLYHEREQRHSPYVSAYPPLNLPEDDAYHIGGPVQSPSNAFNYGVSVLQPQPHFNSLIQNSHTLQYDQYATDNDEMSGVETDGPDLTDAHSQVLVSDILAQSGSTTRGGRRGRGRGRGRGGRRGPGRPKNADPIRGGWNKGTKTGPRPALEPSAEFKALLEQATDARLDISGHDKAIRLILQAIEINPEVHEAHVLLSEIYFERGAEGDEQRGIEALFVAAHALPSDSETWHRLAKKHLEVASVDRTALELASYCYQRLLQIDRDDDDARFGKAMVSHQLGHHTKALKDIEVLLQKVPHSSVYLKKLAEVCLDVNDVGKAIGAYEDALAHQRLHDDTGTDMFTWDHLMTYVDLVAHRDGARKALQILNQIARWLMGRADESYWDDFPQDDREWDVEDVPRRIEVSQFRPGLHEANKYGSGLSLYVRTKLGSLRLKNGNRQEALAHFDWLAPDARDEYNPINTNEAELFLQVADELREVKEYERALKLYEALRNIDAEYDADFWLGLGACSYVCGKTDQALECYELVRDADPTSGEARTQLAKLYAAKGDRETALSLARSAILIYESQLPNTQRRRYERKDLREAREAAQKAYKEAYRLQRTDPRHDEMPKPQFTRRARARTRRAAKEAEEKAAATEEGEEQVQDRNRSGSLEPPQREDGLRSRQAAIEKMKISKRSRKEKTMQERHDNVQQLYSTLRDVTEAMRGADDIARNVWMDCAEALVEDFRKERAMYPGERYIKFRGFDRALYRSSQQIDSSEQRQAEEDMPLPSVESIIPTEYCGIVFSEWLDIFLEYAMLLASMQEDTKECYTVIQAALDCSVWYHDPQAILQIYTCYLACALAFRDELTLFNVVIRWFMREFVFCTDTYRLFGALNYFYPFTNDKAGKLGQMNTAIFRQGPNQKFLFRQIMGVDSQLPQDYGINSPHGTVPAFMRKTQNDIYYLSDRLQPHSGISQAQPRAATRNDTVSMDEDETVLDASTQDDGEILARRTYSPKELDVVLLSLYAQILYAGGSFPNALSYFFRAYTLEPKNPILLFQIALCYMHQMMKRQNENRHMYLLHGWSFFDEYADARIEWAEAKEKESWPGLVTIARKEVEFNRARCWQMLGMNDLAIRSFGKMLDARDIKTEDQMDIDHKNDSKGVFNMEAAYAMVHMYAVSGDMDSARQMTEKYLVIE